MYAPGKLPPDVLESLFDRLPSAGDRVIAGPAIGEDTAVIDHGDMCLLVTTDPITFVAANIGWYAVVINVNDVAVMGGLPKWFLPVVLLPESQADRDTAESIFTEIGDACRSFGITVIGGHTEVTPGIEHPIVAALLIGEVPKDTLVDKRRIAQDDLLYLAGGIAIEAVSIIAREKPEKVAETFGGDFLRESQNYLYDPGISVLNAAQTAVLACPVHGMHDPTEGGLLGGICELAARAGAGAGAGVEIDRDAVEILPHCEKLCDLFGLDPLRLIASGSLLIAVDRSHSDALEKAFTEAEIPLGRIGRFTADPGSRILRSGEIEEEIRLPVVDEIHKIWE